MSYFNFEKLQIWNEARELVKEIYKITASFPKEEVFGLTSQLRRAAVSILLNLAEGQIGLPVRRKSGFMRCLTHR